MKFRSLFNKFGLFVLCAAIVTTATAQKPPRQEKLLNGLKLVMLSDPTAPDVKVSIRVHSGSAFDPQGKEGVMQLLADNLFPTPASKSFFVDDLGGTLEVITNYDYIQINASAKATEFVTLVETLAQAVSSPTIDKEVTAALKRSLIERLTALEKDPVYVAEQAAAKRLFGTFPYGRPQMGSVESLQRIDSTDLQFAKERFLAADNATVALSGNFNSDLGFRAARRYFGAWIKADKRIPSTFRQPDEPDTKPLEIVFDGTARTSFALRGLARNDPDFAAALIFENILRARLQRKAANMTVAHQARALPGVLIVSAPGSVAFPFALFSERISQSEFAEARSQAAAEFSKKSVMDQWLDVDTYRTTVAGDASSFQNVALADVQRVADRLAKTPIASVVVKPVPAAQ